MDLLPYQLATKICKGVNAGSYPKPSPITAAQLVRYAGAALAIIMQNLGVMGLFAQRKWSPAPDNLNDPQSYSPSSRLPSGVCSYLILSPLAIRPTTAIGVNTSGSGGFQSGPSKSASANNPSAKPANHADHLRYILSRQVMLS